LGLRRLGGWVCGARASVFYTRTREEMCVDFGFSTYLIPGLLVPEGVHL
jgi:hypothetical protein